MAPKLFESITFLKFNNNLWNSATVCDAVRSLTKEMQSKSTSTEDSEVCGDEDFYYL